VSPSPKKDSPKHLKSDKYTSKATDFSELQKTSKPKKVKDKPTQDPLPKYHKAETLEFEQITQTRAKS